MPLLKRTCVAGLLALAFASAGLAQTVDTISPAPGFESTLAYGVSDLGDVVVGSSTDRQGVVWKGFTWTRDAGRVDFGLFGGMPSRSYVFGISNDGSTAVGMGYNGGSGPWGRGRAARYREGVAENLGTLSGMSSSRALDANENASVVVGYAEESGTSRAFRWTEASGMASMGVLRAGDFTSKALSVSRSGNRVVGTSGNAATQSAFSWTPDGGMQELPPLGQATLSAATAVSSNGDIVVGTSGFRPVMWRDGQVEYLGGYGGSEFGISPLAVDDAGSMVAGYLDPPGNHIAAVWTPEAGTQPLAEYLMERNIPLPQGLLLLECYAISADGRTMCGRGLFSGTGIATGFVIQIPAPSTPWLVLWMLGAVHMHRTRRSA